MATTTINMSNDQLTKSTWGYQPEVVDGNYKLLCALDAYDRAGTKPGSGVITVQRFEFGSHSSPTELTGLGYNPIGLSFQTTGFFGQFGWHAVVWPMIMSFFESEMNTGPTVIEDQAKNRLENVTGEAMRRKEQHILAGGQTGYSGLTTWNGYDVSTGIFEAAAPAAQTHSIGGLSRVTFAAYQGLSVGYAPIGGSYSSNGERAIRSAIAKSRQMKKPADRIFASLECLNNHQHVLSAHEVFAKDEVSGRMVTQWQGIPTETSQYMPGIGMGGSVTTTAGSEISAYGVNMKAIPLVTLGQNKLKFLGWQDVPGRPIKVGLLMDISQIIPNDMAGSWSAQGGDVL